MAIWIGAVADNRSDGSRFVFIFPSRVTVNIILLRSPQVSYNLQVIPSSYNLYFSDDFLDKRDRLLLIRQT